MSGSRAVVVGSGLAGMAAAAALGEHLDEVLIVERDRVAGSAPRPGVPQGGQLHNLLSSAQRALEQLLPGFCEGLRSAGAGEARVSTDTEVFELGEQMPLRDLGMRLMCAPRPTIERVARRRLLERGGVTVLEGTRALGLELEPSGRVAGVTVESGGARRSIGAQLVVDATGFRGAGSRWLRAAGLEAPRVETQRVERWYVSGRFERAADEAKRDRFWLVFPTPPGTRSGLVAPLDRGHWQISLSGCFSDRPPQSAKEMETYAATLEAPWIAELISRSRPAGEPNLFRKPWATWRRFDRMRRPLPGLLPIGDAIASLNPLFGQGMSVAAKQAVGLAGLLADGVEDPADLTRSYLPHAAAACSSAWQLGQLVEGNRAAALDGRSTARLLQEDPSLHRLYVGVWHLLEPATSLPQSVFPQSEPDR